ncbi:methyltransferase-like protein 7B [Caerostris darwini]|uniref:Methyltransferase-like protein 7B n=1 Tax=Caerostris darwini TaxID=1538125 RepID=A0AAV4S736_9ARAC|nr:methyltransferase-like protein 7B [Caerostris darwini]
MSAVSWLLPLIVLLKVNETFRNKFFSKVFMEILAPIFPNLESLRKRPFEILQEHLTNRKLSTPLEILEIGVGGGGNLEYYPENSNLTALDKNDTFSKYFEDNKKKFSHVTYKKTVCAMAENMEVIEDSSMDVVISTFVLCSVEDIEAVIREVKRVLKPGGKFLFSEHVAYPDSHLASKVQNFAAPLWKLFFDGCILNRKTTEEIRKGGFFEC